MSFNNDKNVYLIGAGFSMNLWKIFHGVMMLTLFWQKDGENFNTSEKTIQVNKKRDRFGFLPFYKTISRLKIGYTY